VTRVRALDAPVAAGRIEREGGGPNEPCRGPSVIAVLIVPSGARGRAGLRRRSPVTGAQRRRMALPS
jgi:hypothetical protein